MMESSGQKLANPFPHLVEATDAAFRIFQAQRDYLVVSAELRAKQEGRRAAFLGAALVFVIVMATLSLFWASYALYELGVPSWALAVGSLLIFGAIAALLARHGARIGKEPSA